jgi:hypothetical protein
MRRRRRSKEGKYGFKRRQRCSLWPSHYYHQLLLERHVDLRASNRSQTSLLHLEKTIPSISREEKPLSFAFEAEGKSVECHCASRVCCRRWEWEWLATENFRDSTSSAVLPPRSVPSTFPFSLFSSLSFSAFFLSKNQSSNGTTNINALGALRPPLRLPRSPRHLRSRSERQQGGGT